MGAALGSAVGVSVGPVLGAVERGGRVVTVSGGSEVVGGAPGVVGRGVAITVRVGDGTTVAVVDALSPPLTMTMVAMTASTSTPAAIAATGRHRWSAGPV